MNGTNDGHDASAPNHERLDQLLSLRQDGQLDAREAAELEALLAADGTPGERARARARAFAEVDASLRRLAAQTIAPARLARGLEAIERRVAAEAAGAREAREAAGGARAAGAAASPSARMRAARGRGRFARTLGFGFAAAAGLVFALFVTTRGGVDETPPPPTLAQGTAAGGARNDETSRAPAESTLEAMPEEMSEAPTEVVADATPERVDGPVEPVREAVDDSTVAPAEPPLVAELDSDVDEPVESVAVAEGVAAELASLGIEEASDLEVIDDLELLDFLATRDAAPEEPRG